MTAEDKIQHIKELNEELAQMGVDCIMSLPIGMREEIVRELSLKVLSDKE